MDAKLKRESRQLKMDFEVLKSGGFIKQTQPNLFTVRLRCPAGKLTSQQLWKAAELAEKYGEPVPDLLPAHWLPNRWGQDWTALVTVEGLDLSSALAEKDAEWVVRQAERFFVSLGYDELPESFYERSSLYPLPKDANYKKNNHASAWHLDLQNYVRSLMSVEANPSLV